LTTYLLDACALLAYVKKEPESVKVKELFDRALIREIAICISVINLTEAYYGLIRNDGMETAGEIMKSLDELPLSVIDTVSRAVSRDAARFKVSYSMSLADTFLCATAKSLSATIVTKDSEIEAAVQPERLAVLWIK
jgi:predicted nucleic acid-binding protein